MKKLFAILSIAAMIFTFAACDQIPEEFMSMGGELLSAGQELLNSFADSMSDGDETSNIFDFNSVLSGNGSSNTVWGQQDQATKNQIIEEGKKEGLDISFGSDGSMTVYDPKEGTTVKQNPDGTWVVKDGNGSESQYGGNWPENEFTRQLPKPDIQIGVATSNEEEFAVVFKDATVDMLKEYVELIKAKGFTQNSETTDQNVMGMTIYTYTAENGNGYKVTVSHAAGASTLLVEKA